MSKSPAYFWYTFRDACAQGLYDEAEGLLNAHPSLRTATNRVGETVLHWLAVENHLEAVAWLHARGFAIDGSNHFGTPMFFEVAFLGYHDLLRWLAERMDFTALMDMEDRDVFAYLAERTEDPSSDFLRSLTNS
jgi:ankyrin repeat protein